MFPRTSDFSRDVEVNENDEKELTLKFDLKDYKVRIYKLKIKIRMQSIFLENDITLTLIENVTLSSRTN